MRPELIGTLQLLTRQNQTKSRIQNILPEKGNVPARKKA